MKYYDYLFVGGGLFSATVAYHAVKHGKKCLVVEKRPHLGGNVYTEKISGINVHKYGPHIFHTDNTEVWNFINQFADFNRYINCPLANYKGIIYNLPFNMNTFTKIWPDVITPLDAKKKIAEQISIMAGKIPRNLEEQSISLVGYDIYEKFIKGYSEKQWGRKCTEIPAFIIKRLPVRFTFDNNYFNDRYQGIPIGGYTKIIEKMFDGCDIRLNTDFFDNKKNFIASADKVIYTGTIDKFFNYQFGELEYRSLRFEIKEMDTDNFQGNAVINYTDSEIPYTRIIEHKHFESKKAFERKTVVSYEFPDKWNHFTEPYYPICDDKNLILYEKYKLLAKEYKKIHFGGRLGMYKYFDMDDTISNALEFVKHEFREPI